MCFHTQHWPQHCSKLGITNYLHYFFFSSSSLFHSHTLPSLTHSLLTHSLSPTHFLTLSHTPLLTTFSLPHSLSLTHSLSPHTHSLTHSLSLHTLSLTPSLPTLSHSLPLSPHSLTALKGITNYNLLGHFSSLSLLNHFWLVLSYNALFFLLTIIILFKKATQTVLLEVTYLLREKLKILRIPKLFQRKRKLQ